MRKYILAILVLIFSFTAYAAKNDLNIVAVVGDDVISSLDVKNRINLAISSSGLQPTRDIKEKLFPQIVRALIDEHLYAQEAARLNITVTQQDISMAMANLEKQNSLKAGTFKQFLEEKGIPSEAAIEQLRSQLLWNKIINRKVRPKIIITDKELEEKMEHISHSSGIAELRISEIILPIDSPGDKKQVRALAEKLVKELREGADFASVAKEFSHSSANSDGGDLGWIQEEHLPKEIVANVRNLSVGEISDPFLGNDSYNIVKLNDRRALINVLKKDSKLGIKQAFIPVSNDVSPKKREELSSNLERWAKEVKTCEEFPAFAKKVNSAVSPELINVQSNALSGEVKNAISKTEVNKLTPVIKGPNGLYVFMVCDKPGASTTLVMKNNVKELLFRRKLDLQAQRYLRNLRHGVFIEIRT